MSQSLASVVAEVTTERANWACHACGSLLSEVVLAPEAAYLIMATAQLNGRVNLPVTFHCGRCHTDNHLAETDIQRWQRRGARGPVLSAWRSETPLARPA